MTAMNHSEDRSLNQNHAQGCPYRHLLRNEQGFVLVGSLLILLLLVLIGISATTSTILELQIAGADRVHRETFYNADAGTGIGSELIENSISCPAGFKENFGADALLGPDPATPGTLYIPHKALTLWANPPVDIDGTKTSDTSDDVIPRATLPGNRDASFNFDNANFSGTPVPRVDIQLGGATELSAGSSLQQLAGYEGVGKSLAGGGSSILYDIHSIAFGRNNSESWLIIEWRHVIGKEGACRY